MADNLKYSPFADLSGPKEKEKNALTPLIELGLLALGTVGKARTQERTAVVGDLNSRVKYNAKSFTTPEEFAALGQELEQARLDYGGDKKTGLHIQRLNEALMSLNQNFMGDMEIKAFHGLVDTELHALTSPKDITKKASELWEAGNQIYNKHRDTKDGPIINRLDRLLDDMQGMNIVYHNMNSADMGYGPKVKGVPTAEWDIKHELYEDLNSAIQMKNFKYVKHNMDKIKQLDELIAKDLVIKPKEKDFNAFNEEIIQSVKALEKDLGKEFKKELLPFAPAYKDAVLNRGTIPIYKTNIIDFTNRLLKHKKVAPEFTSDTVEKQFNNGGLIPMIEAMQEAAQRLHGKTMRNLNLNELKEVIADQMTFEEEQSFMPFGWWDEPGKASKHHNLLAMNMMNYWSLESVDRELIKLGK